MSKSRLSTTDSLHTATIANGGIDEIHRIREEWAAKFNYDAKALLENIEQQKQQDYLTDENGDFIKDEKGGLILKPQI